MASTINALSTGSGGLVSTGDASGQLELQTNSTTRLTITTAGAIGIGSTPSYGTSGQVLTSAGSAAAPTWSTPSSASLSEFTSSGTWTKPSGANFVMVEVLGAGGGGGSGRRGATSTDRWGGAGGGGGAFARKLFAASELGSKVTVTVGAGGTGGAARTADNTSGASGTTGGQSAFGSYVRVWGGTAGGGGGTTSANPGLGGGTLGSNIPVTQLSSGNDFVPGSFARSVRRTGGAYDYPGAGYGGGGGGLADTAINNIVGGESSTYGGAGGGAGGGISSGNTLSYSGQGGGNFNRSAVSGYLISNFASGMPGVSKWGGGGGSAFDNTNNTQFYFTGAAFGNSTFVVIQNSNAENYNIQTSTNSGSSWTQYKIGFPCTSILWDGTKWVGFAFDGRVFTTTNFTTWSTAASFGDYATGISSYGMAYNSGLYVGVSGSGLIQTSTDLITWTNQSSGVTKTLQKVVYDGSKWLVAGDNAFLTSTDGITWTDLSANLPATFAINQLASSGSVYLIHGYKSTAGQYQAYYSTNGGTSWTQSTGVNTGNQPNGAIYSNGRFLIANGNLIQYSTDGVAFSTGYTATGSDLIGGNTDNNCLAGDGTTYIAAYYYVDTNQYAAVYSANATSWTGGNASNTLPSVAGSGGAGGIGAGGGGGGASLNGYNSGAGGAGGAGLVRVYTW